MFCRYRRSITNLTLFEIKFNWICVMYIIRFLSEINHLYYFKIRYDGSQRRFKITFSRSNYAKYYVQNIVLYESFLNYRFYYLKKYIYFEYIVMCSCKEWIYRLYLHLSFVSVLDIWHSTKKIKSTNLNISIRKIYKRNNNEKYMQK